MRLVAQVGVVEGVEGVVVVVVVVELARAVGASQVDGILSAERAGRM